MDEPISIRARYADFYKEPYDLRGRLDNALRYDDKDTLLRLIKDPVSRACFNPSAIMLADAIRIGTAVFEGETEGIIDVKDMLMDEMTPVHVSAAVVASKLTKYLVERGDDVDAVCDVEVLDFKQATPLDLALESTVNLVFQGYKPEECQLWCLHKSIIELFAALCQDNRDSLEVVRLLVQKTQNKERVRQKFIDYADKGRLAEVAALFLAAPELFLPSIVSMQSRLSSLDKRTDLQEGLSLLLDVFTFVGDKFVSYIRLEDDFVWELGAHGQQEIITFLLREAAHQKIGVSSRNDYFLSFFKPVTPYVGSQVDQLASLDLPDELKSLLLDNGIDYEAHRLLPFFLKRKDIDIDYINRMIPTLKPEDAVCLYRAINNKVSSMSSFRGPFEAIAMTSLEKDKYLPQWIPFVSGGNFEPVLGSFPIKASSVRPKFDSKFTIANSFENKLM